MQKQNINKLIHSSHPRMFISSMQSLESACMKIENRYTIYPIHKAQSACPKHHLSWLKICNQFDCGARSHDRAKHAYIAGAHKHGAFLGIDIPKH